MIARQTIRCDSQKPSKIARPRVRKPVGPHVSIRTFLRVECLEDRTVPSTFTVANTADNGLGSLRQAILSSNGSAGPNTINFDIGSNSQTIALLSPLPPVSIPATIDATPPAGFPTQAIVLNGSAAGAGADGLDITAGGSTIIGDEHLAIDSFSGTGVLLETAGGDMVEHTFIGTDMSSASGLGNSIGIMIMGTANNTIGGANIVSANMAQGIVVTGPGATGNLIENNIVGTDRTGTIALPNGGDGVLIEDGASANSVLGVSGHANLISANGGDGVHITGAGTDDNLILSAVIGTNVTGEAALGNSLAGVAIDMGASGNTIGATSGPSINLISGNGGAGVEIGASDSDSGISGNVVDDNAIGTDLSGTKGIPNGGDGVLIQGGSSGNTIGGTSGAINLIAGNTGWGVVIDGGGGTGNFSNQVDKNAIGTDVTGTVALANGLGGVEVTGASTANIIGGLTGGGAINVIAGNTGMAQVFVDDATDTLIVANAIGTDVTLEKAFASATGDGILIEGGALGTAIGLDGFNVISGNAGNGITIDGSTGVVIADCAIGTDVTGTVALPNANGVVIENSSTGTGNTGNGNQVGAAGAYNLISGNTGAGILIQGSNGSTVEASAIGLDVTGTKAIPNMNGIVIDQGSTGNQIGFTGTTNIISGNANDGILIEGDGNTVQGNVIGADVSGASPVANGAAGVEITGNNNNIGPVYKPGPFPFTGNFNIIAFNTTDGVLVDSGTGNAIHQNPIFSNAGLGIDLVSGANAGVMPPTLTSVTVGASGTTITGTLAGLANTTYLIEFYVNPSTSPDQGETPVLFVTETTNASGTVTFTAATSAMLQSGQTITATATDPSGNTSEFSNSVS